MPDVQLLSIMVPQELRDDVVDALISCAAISGFNMQSIAGYSREHSLFDLSEQVAGYRSLFEFEVLHTVADEAAVLQALRDACRGTRVRYWVTPVVREGHL
tara:strand:+ start:76921 stop:77223 length:303 start_codon:yes stop_codon:yes gene_type:complete